MAIMARERWDQLPDVPTFLEKGYDVVRGSWYSAAVPKGTPQAVLDILREVFKKTADDPQVKASISGLGYMMLNWSLEETKKQSQAEFDLAREAFKKAGLL